MCQSSAYWLVLHYPGTFEIWSKPLNGGDLRDYMGPTIVGIIKGDTRSLDSGTCRFLGFMFLCLGLVARVGSGFRV